MCCGRNGKEILEELVEPCLTCGHSGTLFWCSVHKRYECEKCCMEDEEKAE